MTEISLLLGQLRTCADCAVDSPDGKTYLNTAARPMLREAADLIETMRAALRPFAAFADKAEAFVAARAKDGGSPILPSTDFRLSDFKQAAAALSSHKREAE